MAAFKQLPRMGAKALLHLLCHCRLCCWHENRLLRRAWGSGSSPEEIDVFETWAWSSPIPDGCCQTLMVTDVTEDNIGQNEYVRKEGFILHQEPSERDKVKVDSSLKLASTTTSTMHRRKWSFIR